MAKRTYTAEDKARVYAILDANDGNVKRTARDTGIAVQTVRDWKLKREREGSLPVEIEAALHAAQLELVENTSRVRDKVLDRLEREVDDPAARASIKDLATTYGILTDKVRLIEGKPTSVSEDGNSVGSLPIEQVRELFEGFARGVVEGAAKARATISSAVEEEPIDGVYVEQVDDEPLALPAHTV
jgi:transposase-like protein